MQESGVTAMRSRTQYELPKCPPRDWKDPYHPRNCVTIESSDLYHHRFLSPLGLFFHYSGYLKCQYDQVPPLSRTFSFIHVLR